MEPQRRKKPGEKPKKQELVQEHGRSNSLWIRMRNFHNFVKFQLIEESVKELKENGLKKLSLLDISVGRGGDLYKWNKAGISNVVGIDPHEKSIEEAQLRVDKFSKENKGRKIPNVFLEVGKITEPNIKIPNQDYFDIVSCQFTLHYFFESREMLTNAIKNISKSLLPGGFFIGTTYSGTDILKNAKKLSSTANVEFEYLGKNDFTGSYTMSLKDVDDAGNYLSEEIEKESLVEYLVDLKQFKILCEENDMDLVEWKTFKDIYNSYKSKDMKDYEKTISFLSGSFVFRKKLNLNLN